MVGNKLLEMKMTAGGDGWGSVGLDGGYQGSSSWISFRAYLIYLLMILAKK